MSFALELKGIPQKIKYFFQELLSLSTRIRPNGIQQVIWKGPKGNLILNYYDSIVCWRAEILDDHLYDVKLPENPVILDIGANQGFATLWFKYNYPNATIYSFEPVKRSFDILIKNIMDNNMNAGTHLFNLGVGDKDEIIKIHHRPGGAGLGDTISTLGVEGCESEDAKIINIDFMFKDNKKIDLVKIDVEGSEYKILKNCDFWKKADKIIIEFHDQFKESFGFKDINFVKLITDAGFKLEKQIGAGPIYVCYFLKTI